jgi:PAS domain S-box-containing protein
MAATPFEESNPLAAPPAGTAAEREQAELRRVVEISAREWQRTVDALDSPVLVMELDGRVRRLNRAAASRLGRDFPEAIGRTLPELGHEEPWLAATEAVESSRARLGSARRQCRDAAGRTWELVTKVSRQGGPTWVVLVLHDLTERMALEERVRRHEVMSALGSLVAGVAHEARNPLFGISAALDAFASRFGDDPRFTPFLDVLQGEVDRLRKLVQDLFEYGKAPTRALSPDQVGVVLQDAVGDCAGLADQREVGLEVACAEDLPQVLLDRARLAYVFRNLVQNALQHARPGTTVEVRLAAAGARAGAGVRCTVRDLGPGFAPDDLPRICEPFFSRRRGGFGLGLAIAQRIVEEHGGRLRARNHPGGGAELEVWLPSLTAPAPVRTGAAAEGGG